MLSAEQQAEAQKRLDELAKDQEIEKNARNKISSFLFTKKMFPRH